VYFVCKVLSKRETVSGDAVFFARKSNTTGTTKNVISARRSRITQAVISVTQRDQLLCCLRSDTGMGID
jgi:hypothetical protein